MRTTIAQSQNNLTASPERPEAETNLNKLSVAAPETRNVTREDLLRKVQPPNATEVRSGAALHELIDGTKTLIHTAKGAPFDPIIEAVQKRLVAAGITEVNGNKLEIDGRFGLNTAAAIAAYREREKLPAGEQVDRELLTRMMSTNKEQKASPSVTSEPTSPTATTNLENAGKALHQLPTNQAQALSRKLETLTGGNSSIEGKLAKVSASLGIDLSNEAGIKNFQQLRGIEVDGDLGPVTARHLAEVVSAEWLRRCVTQQSTSHEWRTDTHELNVVGLRGWNPERGQNANLPNLWNDTIAMVWKDENGLVRFKEFPATCDPGIKRNSQAPDVNGDGRGDVGHIAPGQYLFKHGYYKGMSGFGVPASGKDVEVYRDTNGDGKISSFDSPGPIKRTWERFRSFFGNDTFKFHGLRNSRDPDTLSVVGGASAGCQVPKLTNNQFKREISPLLAANPGPFPYTLIDLSTNNEHASPLGRQFAQMNAKSPVSQ